MSNPVPIAAIDVGSNAIRLVLGQIEDDYSLTIVKKYRKAIRLGHDAFSVGSLSEKIMEQTLAAFREFREILAKKNVFNYRAVGTSALREARNGSRLAEQILFETNLHLEIISAHEEGRLIHQAVERVLDLRNRNALLIDIGGGSVEATQSVNGEFQVCESYPLGTVRLLEKLQKEHLASEALGELISQNKEVFQFINRFKRRKPIDFCVGTGGNFECLGELAQSICKTKSDQEFTLDELNAVIEQLTKYTEEGRIKQFGLPPDRADVIMPAALLAQSFMVIADVTRTYVPDVGLKEGVLYDLTRRLTMF